jgi:hypothetical protein
MRIGALLVVVWLLIGAFAAYPRGYFSRGGNPNCAEIGTVMVTIVVGPLNYAGVNPKINCTVPQPSG